MENIINAQVNIKGHGEIKLKLYPDIAPKSVENFVKLANEGFFDGLIFHRNIPNFMIQGGGFKPGMKEKKGAESIYGEFSSNGHANSLSHKTGVISMARTNVPNSASSQFFICVNDCAFLDGQYASFGECADEDSKQLAIKLSKVPTMSVGYYDDVPFEDVVIESIKII